MAEKPLRRLVEIGVTTNLHCLPLLLLESLVNKFTKEC